MSEIILPWPPTVLSPNDSSHWAKKAKVKKQYRTEAWAITKAANIRVNPDNPIQLDITFVRPSRRSYDQDNLIARMKSGFDGIADGLGVNDKLFRLGNITITDHIGGMVKITINSL